MKISNNDNAQSTRKIKEIQAKRMIDGWKEKPMHGQLTRRMEELAIDKKLSNVWLQFGNLKGETESLLTAAQEQAINTRYHDYKIHKRLPDGKCRYCKDKDETIDHIMSACPVLAKEEYLHRHNNVCTQIHYNICENYGCDVEVDKWYKHKPRSICLSKDKETRILYDEPVQTDRTVHANRPDIIIREQKITYLIDVSVPSDYNIITKEAEKLLKYKDLAIEIQRMWKTKVKIVPIIIGSTGYVGKNFKQYLESIPGTHDEKQLQKTTVLGTAHIIRKALT